MSAQDFPGPAAEIAQWHRVREASARLTARAKAREGRRCSSCGGGDGHRRGDRACPNYDTPVRWQAHGKVYVTDQGDAIRRSS